MNLIEKVQTMPIFQTFWLLLNRPRVFVAMLQIQALPTFVPFLALMAGDESLDVVGAMSLTLLETPSFKKAVAYLCQDAACADLIKARYMSPPHDLDRLLECPKDSLGYLYAVQMKKRGFRAEELYEEMSIQSDASYIEARLSQTHDIWHIVTGFGVTGEDEIGLQAFHLPQFPYPLAIALLSSSLMSTLLFAPEELPALLESIYQGWTMGKLAKPLFAQKWEEGWDKPLAQWQAELNIYPLASLSNS
jgi:ubiquinone biosynthesis protein COQ4